MINVSLIEEKKTTSAERMGLPAVCMLAVLLFAGLFQLTKTEDASKTKILSSVEDASEKRGDISDQEAEQMNGATIADQLGKPTFHVAPDTSDASADEVTSGVSLREEEVKLTTATETEVNSGSEDADRTKVMLQAFGPLSSSEDENSGIALSESSSQQTKDESWMEQTDSGTEQKRSSGRRFFSLMNLIKFLLNPVIEEFQEVDKSSNSTDVAQKSPANSSEATEKEETKNTTDSTKKTKFQCVGRNITENTTAVVRVVNSTVLLELLSFDKNQTASDCVLVMFYAPWCYFCALTAPHYNAVGRAFPQLDVLAVDTVHFSNLNARFGTVAVPNIMLFHQSRSAVRFNHTERHFDTLVQFIKNTTGLEPNTTVTVTEEDLQGPLASIPTEETDYLLWFAWIFMVVCGGHLFIQSRPGQRAIERVKILWQEHQHIE